MYLEWNDVTNRYGVSTLGDASDVTSTHIVYAENELNSRLAPKFTVPFSDNNLTAKDLSIDLTYLRVGDLKTKEYDAFKKRVDERIARLLKGEENMVNDDGSTIQSVGGTLWSNTEQYTPVFGFGEVEDFEVDPDLVQDENDARS